MLTSVDVSAEQPGTTPLELLIGGSENSPIQVKNIEGLGPVNATMASVGFGTFDGEDLGQPSVGKRNILLTLGLNPDWATQTLEELRQLLYVYFMPKANVTLEFTSTHLPTCEISGVVETMTPNMFSADPEIVVSILCGDPDFVATAQTTVNGVVVTDSAFTVVPYAGSKPTGFNLKVASSVANVAYTGDITIITQWVATHYFELDEITIDATHYLELNSVPRSKYVQTVLTPALTPTSVMNKIIGSPEWPQLRPGNNNFSIDAGEAGQAWTITYFARFGGL